jgi:hypothetical protein
LRLLSLFERLASESQSLATLARFNRLSTAAHVSFCPPVITVASYTSGMHKIGHGGTHLTSWAQELHSVALVFWRMNGSIWVKTDG